MKYLRKYNESIDQDDIVLNCLDLIDNGFEIQELSGGLSKFIFRLERRDTISLPEGVDLHNLHWLEKNYPENMFYIIKDNYRPDLYGYRIAQVINEGKTSIMFFDYLNKLRDFCEGNLVYLLDDGFEVTVRPKSDNKILVRICKPSSDNGSQVKNLTFIKLTDEFKDYVIPFLQRIKSNYNIASIVFKTCVKELRSNRFKDILISDINEIETLTGYISCVDIEIREVEKHINEAFAYSDEKWEEMELDLEEYCNSNLAFLLDEGFEIYINPQKTIDKFYVTLYKPKDYTNEDFGRQRFELDDIKDHIIPFMNRLIKDYNVDSILLVGFVINRPPGQKMMMDYKPYTHKIKSPDDLEDLSGTLHYFNFEIYLPNIS